MNFIVDIPCTLSGHDSIWITMDRLTKLTYFLPIKTTYKVIHLVSLFIAKIIQLHGVSASIVFKRDLKLNSRFWKASHHQMGTNLIISTSNHPQLDGKTKRTIQVVEDMLWACILES